MYYDMKASGARIRTLRDASGYTQEQLAIQLGVSDRHIRLIESGQCGASVDLLVELSELFNVSLDYLVLGRRVPQEYLKVKIHQLIVFLSMMEREL